MPFALLIVPYAQYHRMPAPANVMNAETEPNPNKANTSSEMGLDGRQVSPGSQGLLKVPSRSSSQQQRNQSPTASTGLSGATVTDPRNSIGGRSKISNPGRQRNGSGSTNQTGVESDQARPVGNSHPSSPSSTEQKRKRRKNGGLLSLFGCCGVPDTANNVEGDSENVHKVEKLPQRPATAKTRAQGPPEQQSAKPPQEKESLQASPSDAMDIEASTSAQPMASDHTDARHETKQTSLPAVTVDSPPSVASGDTEMKDLDEAVDSEDAVMPETRQEEPREAPELNGPDDSQSRTTTMPTSAGPGPAAVASVPLVESMPSAAEQQSWLLPPITAEHKGRKCLVLDLDETLVHSSFKVRNWLVPFTLSSLGATKPLLTLFTSQILHQADFTIPVEIEGNYHNVYVIKRPGVDEFMKRVGELYEVVVFTASVSKISGMIFTCQECPGEAQVLTLCDSTATPFWISWIFTKWCTTGSFGRAATTTRVTTSRICPKSAAI